MVCKGYSDAAVTQKTFLGHEGGAWWYRTRDLAQRTGDGIRFVGRADATLKVGGAWMDLHELQVCAVPCHPSYAGRKRVTEATFEVGHWGTLGAEYRGVDVQSVMLHGR